MTAILLTYIATSYSFSGLICSMAFLKASDRVSDVGQEQGYAVKLTCMAIVICWPLWILKEVYLTNIPQSLGEPQTQQYCCSNRFGNSKTGLN